MKRRPTLSAISLQEIYSSTGRYPAKLLIDPSSSLKIESVDVALHDSDRRPMACEVKRWGTKVNLEFVVDDRTADGVAIFDVTLRWRDGREQRERFDCWIIK